MRFIEVTKMRDAQEYLNNVKEKSLVIYSITSKNKNNIDLNNNNFEIDLSTFDFDYKEGDEIKPHIFWDSDVAKWVEGVAYLIQEKREPHLEKIDAHRGQVRAPNGKLEETEDSQSQGYSVDCSLCHLLMILLNEKPGLYILPVGFSLFRCYCDTLINGAAIYKEQFSF